MFYSWDKSLAQGFGKSNVDALLPTKKKTNYLNWFKSYEMIVSNTMRTGWSECHWPNGQFQNKPNINNSRYFIGIKNVSLCLPSNGKYTGAPSSSFHEDRFFDATSSGYRDEEPIDFCMVQKKHISVNTNKILMPSLFTLSWSNLLHLHKGHKAKVNELSEGGDSETSKTNPMMTHRNLWQFIDDFGNKSPIAVSFDSFIDGSTSQFETWVRINQCSENDDISTSRIFKEATTSEVPNIFLNYNNKGENGDKLVYSSSNIQINKAQYSLRHKKEQITDDSLNSGSKEYSLSSKILPKKILKFYMTELPREISVQRQITRIFVNKETECESLMATETDSQSICTRNESRLFSNHTNIYDYSPDLPSTPYDIDSLRSTENDEVFNWKTFNRRDSSRSPSIIDECEILLKFENPQSTIVKSATSFQNYSYNNLNANFEENADIKITYKANYKYDTYSESTVKSITFTSEDTLKYKNFNDQDVTTNSPNLDLDSPKLNIKNNSEKNMQNKNGNDAKMGVDEINQSGIISHLKCNLISKTNYLECALQIESESKINENISFDNKSCFKRSDSDYTLKLSESDAIRCKQHDETFENRHTDNFILEKKLSILKLEKSEDEHIEKNEIIQIHSDKYNSMILISKSHEFTSSTNSTKQLHESGIRFTNSLCENKNDFEKDKSFAPSKKSEITLYKETSIIAINKQKCEIPLRFEINIPLLSSTKIMNTSLGRRLGRFGKIHSSDDYSIQEKDQTSTNNIPNTFLIDLHSSNITKKTEEVNITEIPREKVILKTHKLEFINDEKNIIKYEDDIISDDKVEILFKSEDNDIIIKEDLDNYYNKNQSKDASLIYSTEVISSLGLVVEQSETKRLASDCVNSYIAKIKASLNAKNAEKLTSKIQGKQLGKQMNNQLKKYCHNSRINAFNKAPSNIKAHCTLDRKDYEYKPSTVMTRTGLLSSAPVPVPIRKSRPPPPPPPTRRQCYKFRNLKSHEEEFS